eukprot:7382881-Prymnesium_polylepis.3
MMSFRKAKSSCEPVGAKAQRLDEVGGGGGEAARCSGCVSRPRVPIPTGRVNHSAEVRLLLVVLAPAVHERLLARLLALLVHLLAYLERQLDEVDHRQLLVVINRLELVVLGRGRRHHHRQRQVRHRRTERDCAAHHQDELRQVVRAIDDREHEWADELSEVACGVRDASPEAALLARCHLGDQDHLGHRGGEAEHLPQPPHDRVRREVVGSEAHDEDEGVLDDRGEGVTEDGVHGEAQALLRADDEEHAHRRRQHVARRDEGHRRWVLCRRVALRHDRRTRKLVALIAERVERAGDDANHEDLPSERRGVRVAGVLRGASAGRGALSLVGLRHHDDDATKDPSGRTADQHACRAQIDHTRSA